MIPLVEDPAAMIIFLREPAEPDIEHAAPAGAGHRGSGCKCEDRPQREDESRKEGQESSDACREADL